MERNPARELAFAWIPVFGWVAVVFGLGSSGFDAENTSRFLDPFLEWLLPDWRPWERRQIHVGLRKFAHVFEYAVTALLFYRALCISRPIWPTRRCAALSVAFVLAVGTADELRQSFLTTRTGTVSDVMLDGLGGVLGVGLAVPLLRRREELAAHG